MISRIHKQCSIALLACFMVLCLFSGRPDAEQPSQEERLRRLEEKVEMLIELVEKKDQQIQDLQQRLEKRTLEESLSPDMVQTDREERDSVPTKSGSNSAPSDRQLASNLSRSPTLRLIDLSAIINVASGTSTATSEEIEQLQLGAHDPRRRGFTFQQLELSLAGAVDPYFTGEAHVIFLEDDVELEEAFVVTNSLPWGLQCEIGYFLTEFGLINPSHPHSWDWIDQPVINSRLFGGDGMRSTGLRVGWLTPLPWLSEVHVSAQDPSSNRMASFWGEGLTHSHGSGEEHGHNELKEGIGGRPIIDQEVRTLGDLVYLLRWVNALPTNSEVTAQLGLSGLYGPNNSGDNGETWIYGADLVVKWHPRDHNTRGWPFITWQSEIMKRDYEADAFIQDDSVLASDTLRDWGLYSQILVGFCYPWAAGLRFEYATSRGSSVEDGVRIDTSDDPYRDDRCRLAPLVLWKPTEFSRFRLQYNYDWAEHIHGHDEHSVWLGAEFLFGTHSDHDHEH
ncbi:MAG TPA: hypothetical protein PKJ77_02910 [Thermodesulfobacteriota bacterium]|nr:hypothetical protein [Thermodesulfobacteriota bacterium]HOC38207.1 hypothetical protein [Thermodesulfobacteriota bacterium]